MTKCYALNVSTIDESKLVEIASLLPWQERREKASRYLHIKDKRLCIGAGVLLYRILIKNGISDFTLSKNEYGKEYLKNSDLHFNLSHSGDYVVCAVSDAEVGIDTEFLSDADLTVAEKCFTNYEYKMLQNSQNIRSDFFRLWTLKESFVKKIGMGMFFPFNSFSVKFDDDYTTSIYDARSGNPFAWNEINHTVYENAVFTEFVLPEQYVAVCSATDKIQHMEILKI